MRARVHQLLVLLLGLFALALPATARADSAVNAAAGMSMDVQVGYSGAVRLGAWVPVQVNVANDGPDLAGRVEVQFETGSTPVFYGPPPTVYSIPATFPQHSHKRLVVDVPMPPALRTSSVQVRLVSGNQTVLQQAQPFTPISSGDLACGVLDQTLGSYDFLSSLTLPGRQQRTRVADLTLTDLPGQGALLASLDCLVIGDVNLTSMTASQKLALTSWVGNGGLLIVTGGVNWQQSVSALPPELLPVQVTGIATVTSIAPLDQFAHVGDAGPGPWPVALGSLQNSALVAGSSSTPLLAVRRFGSGTVFFYALDPTQEPARSWAGNRFLWPYMLGFSNTSSSATGYRQALSSWGPTPITALGALPNLNPPQPTWLLLYLLGYGLLVGPLAFLLLRRLDRQEWLLVLLPLAALIGTMTTVRLATQHQGSDIAATEVTLLRTNAQSPVAQAHTYVGLYSPRPQTIDLHVPAGALFASVRRAFGQFGGAGATGTRTTPTPLQISEGMDVFVPALQLDTGTLSTFTVDSQATLGGGIIATLTADNQVVRGQIQNKTGQRITNAALVLGNTVHPLGTLNPNETRSVSMALPASSSSTTGGVDNSVAARLYPPATSGNGNIEDPRRDVLDRVFSSTSFTDGNVQGGVLFVGWLDYTPLHIEVRQARAAMRQLTLLEAQLTLTIDTATLDTISSALISERSLQSLGVTQTQAGHYSVATGGSLGVEYDLPSAPHFTIQTLHLLVDGGFSGGAPLLPGDNLGTISAFNWSVDAWQPLPLAAGDNVYQAAGQYVSPTGQVRLRYSFKATAGSSASGVDFTQFALTAAGQAS
jgi:hypothetical protein